MGVNLLQGLLAVPCVVGQLSQIFMGQPIANYLASMVGQPGKLTVQVLHAIQEVVFDSVLQEFAL